MEGISVISQSSSLYPVDVTFHLLNCSHVVLQPNVSVTSHHVPFTRFRPDFLAPFVSLLPPLKPLALSSSVTWVSRVAINSSPPNPPTPIVYGSCCVMHPLFEAQPHFSQASPPHLRGASIPCHANEPGTNDTFLAMAFGWKPVGLKRLQEPDITDGEVILGQRIWFRILMPEMDEVWWSHRK